MSLHRVVVVLVSLAVTAGAGCGASRDPEPTLGALEERLQALVDGAVHDHSEVPAAALAVIAPRLDLWWEGADGLANPATGDAMTPDHPVRIASNTKTFVAAAALRLWERRRLGLDDPIAGRLSPESVAVLRSDGYRPDAITVRHLLTHTAGVYDHTANPRFVERILAEPLHRWTRLEQVVAAMAWGDPWGQPGEVFHYSDTGYVLLGEIVERAAGKPLPAAVRELVGFERIGLASTWWETLELRPAGVPALAHQLDGDLDSHLVDASIDLYGGGGLASTVGDLARFMRSLFTGAVYADPQTIEAMLTTVEGARKGPGPDSRLNLPGVYRMGIFVDEVDGLTLYSHTGYWGTAAAYAPELDVAVAATVNQNDARAVLDGLVVQSYGMLREAAGAIDP